MVSPAGSVSVTDTVPRTESDPGLRTVIVVYAATMPGRKWDGAWEVDTRNPVDAAAAGAVTPAMSTAPAMAARNARMGLLLSGNRLLADVPAGQAHHRPVTPQQRAVVAR